MWAVNINKNVPIKYFLLDVLFIYLFIYFIFIYFYLFIFFFFFFFFFFFLHFVVSSSFCDVCDVIWQFGSCGVKSRICSFK